MTELNKRKTDHIELTRKAQCGKESINSKFFYEPLFGQHPCDSVDLSLEFLGKKMKAPLWISSMTGGTGEARHINQNLAQACADFGLGMGLGSCRSLLESDEYFSDFNLRPIIGNDLPFYANIGIVQVDELLKANKVNTLVDLMNALKVDGVFIHINPLQEWFQPEGDFLERPSLEIIKEFLGLFQGRVLVKEVGQGMGPKSLRALLELPIEGIEFAAFGGTNFSKLENLRDKTGKAQLKEPLCYVGHTADEMVEFINAISAQDHRLVQDKNFIISGGIKNYVHGYELCERITANAVYGQARAFLENAKDDYKKLNEYVTGQIEGLKMCKSFLDIRSDV